MIIKKVLIYKIIFPILLLSVGNVFSQEFNEDSLNIYTNNNQLIKLYRYLQTQDTLNLTTTQKAKYYYYKGLLFLFEDNNKNALSYLLKSKKTLQKSKHQDLHFLFNVNDKLLETSSSVDNYSELQPSLIQENCNVANKTQDPNHIYLCRHYEFSDAIDNKNLDTALTIIKEQLNFVITKNLTQYRGAVYSNLGHVYLFKKKYIEALNYYKKAETFFNETNDTLKLVYIKNNIGNYYKLTGNYSKAITYFKSALKIPITVEAASTKKIIFRNLADATYFNGDFKNAALHYEKFALLVDSLDRSSHDKSIIYYNTKYETAVKEKQNLVLKTQKKQTQNLAIALGGSLFLGTIIALLVYKNTKRKQKLAEQEKALESQKLATALKEQELLAIDAMIQGQEKERQRIANDLHDDLGGLMATVKLHFNALKNQKSPELYNKTNNLIEEAYQKVRTVAHAKNAGVIAKQGLLKAVKDMAEKISASNKIQIEVYDHGLENRLENSLELTLFRIIQELTTNIIKHAQATEATIQITNHDDSINIIVEDNGIGFNPKQITQNQKGMGISSIDKRVEHLEGTLTIESEKNKGTTIIIDIPI